jgi:hypothetical protein
MNQSKQYVSMTESSGRWIRRWHNEGGEYHRLDGPAIVADDGTEEWHINGELHRVDGPAVTTLRGKYWFIHNKPHRLDGPAIEWYGGTKEWWVNGKELTQDEFNQHPLVYFYRLCKKNSVK